MKNQVGISIILILFSWGLTAQDLYEIDPAYPVHDLNTHLKVYEDSAGVYTPEMIAKDSLLPYKMGNTLPRMLQSNTIYWGKIDIVITDSIKDWKLNFEDKIIGPPAWTKSNGKVDVYAYDGSTLVSVQKTGVDYPKNQRATNDHWVLNAVKLSDLPLNTSVRLVIKAQGNSMGYPAYFNLSARAPSQRYYHQIYQFNNSFNIFMFGVTFIIFLYHLLQFIYVRDRVYFWFSLWLFVVMLTHAMTIGLFIGNLPTYRFYLWMIIANSIFFTFWFFGRVFINSKEKFPIIDRFIRGLAYFVIAEIAVTALYVLLFNPERDYTGPGIHFFLLNIYTIGSLILSIILCLKKDVFARYFGIGSLIASCFLIIGTLWSLGIMRMPVPLDPYATGMFLQIILYSFGIAYRRQKLNEQNQLERLNAQRSMAEVERMKDLDAIKTRFFANISHEFRTPLTLINGPLEQAKLEAKKTEQSRIELSEKSFEIIKKNTNRLQNLVDQLLDLSKIESGDLHLKLSKGGLLSFIRSQVFSFESMAERQNISLNTHFTNGFESAYYDKDKLEKILSNLLSNAFKYTPSGGAVHVSVSKDADHVLIEIGDTGKGIGKEELNRIFDRFYRVEGTETKGSGIGLALTKELVDLHNGKISVRSEHERGTVFKVRLPLTMAALPETAIYQEEPIPSIKEKEEVIRTNTYVTMESDEKKDRDLVLIVEDNLDLMDYIKGILGQHYQVLSACDGLQGERMAIEHIPDLIVSDVMMPKKDGFQLCHSLKANVKTSHIPILLLTAKAGQANKIEGLSQGADAYLTKPFDAQELLLRVKNLIAARKKIWEQITSKKTLLIDDLDLKSVDDAFLQKVSKTIKENLDNDLLSVEDIAASVGFSRAQLHRKLKALVNKSAGQLVSEIRLNEARNLLVNKAGSVSEIAYSVGFSNMSYFTKSFKEKFGVLPSKI